MPPTKPAQPMVSGRQVAAARALSGVSLAVVAEAAGLPLARLRRLGSTGMLTGRDAAAMQQGLERLGVLLLPEGGGKGAGVRLKFTRADTRQINRLENEGGPPGDDDVP